MCACVCVCVCVCVPDQSQERPPTSRIQPTPVNMFVISPGPGMRFLWNGVVGMGQWGKDMLWWVALVTEDDYWNVGMYFACMCVRVCACACVFKVMNCLQELPHQIFKAFH